MDLVHDSDFGVCTKDFSVVFFFHTAEVRMRNPISRVPSKRRQINNKPVTQFSGGATALPEANSDFNSRVSQ